MENPEPPDDWHGTMGWNWPENVGQKLGHCVGALIKAFFQTIGVIFALWITGILALFVGKF